MKELNEHELECLRKIAKGKTELISPCATNILERLITAGLVERAPHIWLPAQVIRMSYRLTPAGEAALCRR
ncbi:MAG TPA: hypothetical protein VM011_11765 [Gammaproteobacteria bacterium]|nr:hypothetical protein [Gammaproteobacteria bacterium]